MWAKEGIEDIEGVCHSGVRYKDMNNIILVDNDHFYKIDISTNDVMKFENQQCVGIFFSDNNYLYTLSHKPLYKQGVSGFKLYDVENCIEKGQDLSYSLSRV